MPGKMFCRSNHSRNLGRIVLYHNSAVWISRWKTRKPRSYSSNLVPFVNSEQVVFGKVIDGILTLRKIENVATGPNSRPKLTVKITGRVNSAVCSRVVLLTIVSECGEMWFCACFIDTFLLIMRWIKWPRQRRRFWPVSTWVMWFVKSSIKKASEVNSIASPALSLDIREFGLSDSFKMTLIFELTTLNHFLTQEVKDLPACLHQHSITICKLW